MNRPVRKPRVHRLLREERGSTLVEELVTIVIIGLGIVVLVALITTGALGVNQVDDSVRADALARSQLELIKDAAYQSDPLASPYPAVSGIPGYTISVDIEYWNAASGAFQSSLHDDGLQRISITVNSGAAQITRLEGYKVDR